MSAEGQSPASGELVEEPEPQVDIEPGRMYRTPTGKRVRVVLEDDEEYDELEGSDEDQDEDAPVDVEELKRNLKEADLDDTIRKALEVIELAQSEKKQRGDNVDLIADEGFQNFPEFSVRKPKKNSRRNTLWMDAQVEQMRIRKERANDETEVKWSVAAGATSDVPFRFPDGRELMIASKPKSDLDCGVQLWDKTKRGKLKSDQKIAFIKEATGWIFPKGSKLSVPNYKVGEDGSLTLLLDLDAKLRAIETHLSTHDMLDEFDLVMPVDPSRNPKLLSSDRYNLFECYAKTSPDMVANSCHWFARWVTNPWVSENLFLGVQLLKNNTEPSLWEKVTADLEDYSPLERGGPLALILILKRIQDHSESAVEQVRDRVCNIIISKLPGEDIEYVVSLIKSSHKALQFCSTDSRSFVPQDFGCKMLRVFQTSSVTGFNSLFQRWEEDCRTEADRRGTIVVWPPLHEILTLATTAYQRMKSEHRWDVPEASKAAALLSGKPAGKPAGPRDASRKPPLTCWNCGEKGHGVPDCPKPRDEAKIEAAKKKFRERKPKKIEKGKGGTPGAPKFDKDKFKGFTIQDAQGRPMKINKKGNPVLDAKAAKVAKGKAILDALSADQLANIRAAVGSTDRTPVDVDAFVAALGSVAIV